jgi:hypothetical protein
MLEQAKAAMNSTDETAQNILAIPLDAQVIARKHIWQGDWDDFKTGEVADLQRMARLWLMRDEIIDHLYYEHESVLTPLGVKIKALDSNDAQ